MNETEKLAEPELERLLDTAVRLQKAERLAEAKERYRRILKSDPDHPRAIQYLGVIARREGDPARAVRLLERSLQLAPDDIGCHHNLSRAYLNNGQPGKAVQVLERALEKAPETASLWNQLGIACSAQKEFERALEAVANAIDLRPDVVDYRLTQGSIYFDIGQVEAALEAFEAARDVDPENARVHQNIGAVLKALGRMPESEAAYREAVRLSPKLTDAWRALVDLRRFETTDADVRSLEQLFDSGDLDRAQRMSLCFALGKVYDDLGQYDRAFWCFKEGNQEKRLMLQYDVGESVHRFRRIRQVFTPQYVKNMSASGPSDDSPIFILGMPRSGTTLIEQILASHPEVTAGGELYDMNRIIARDIPEIGLQGRYPEWLFEIGRDRLHWIGRRYLEDVRERYPDGRYVTDKMPLNFRYVGLICLALPRAKIIHATRHPADTAFSCFSKLFNEGQDFSYSIRDLGRYYKAYEELMNHWRSVLYPGSMLEVQYERLVEDLEPQISRLLEFCGLPWNDACLRFFETQRGVATASSTQVRRPIYTSSVQRWRRYERHMQPFFRALAEGSAESGPQ